MLKILLLALAKEQTRGEAISWDSSIFTFSSDRIKCTRLSTTLRKERKNFHCSKKKALKVFDDSFKVPNCHILWLKLFS